MKRIISIIALIVAVCNGTWAQTDRIAISSGIESGSIVVGNTNPTGAATVTLTVTPATGYYIEAGDIIVRRTALAAQTRAVEEPEVNIDGTTYDVSAGSVDGTGKGTYTFELEDGYGAYIEATFTACVAISLEVSIKGWTYGETPNNPSVTTASNPGNGDVTYMYKKKDGTEDSYSTKVPKDAGDYTVQATVIATGHYLGGKATADFTIKKAPLTITAENQSKVAGEEDPVLTYTKEGLLDADANVVTGSLKRAEGENVGTYAINLGDLSAGNNYEISFTGATFTITSATFVEGDVKAEAYSGVYDGKAHTITMEVPEDAAVKYGMAEGSYDLSEIPSYTNVGSYTVYFEVTRPNYNPVKGSQTLTISKKDLTIAAEAKTKIYGAADPALTYKAEGLVEGESLEGALTRKEGENVGEYDILQGTLKASDNYNVAYTGARLTIKKASLTVIAYPKTKEAGEEDPELTYTYEGLVAGDTEDVFSGALKRSPGEEAGDYAIMLGTLSAGDNYAIAFQGAVFTITAKEPVKPDPLYNIYVAESVGGEVVTTLTQAKKDQQVNIIVKTEDNYNLENLVVVNNSTHESVLTSVTTDKDNNEFTYFLMPDADVTVAAIFAKQKDEFKQNIFILKNYYGEVVSNLLYAEPGQQVNLETRVKDGYTNVLLDELYVINEKGEQLQLFYLDDPIEKVPVHLFFMKGEKAYVYNSFKGTNGVTDETKSLQLDGILLYLLSEQYRNFLKTSGGTEGAELALSFLANILANFTSDGALHVSQGPEDMCSALMNLQSGWKVKFDFTGIIQLLNPELLGKGEGSINLTSGQIYELLSPGNLKLLMKSSDGPLLINSITVIPPESQDPTAISGLQADKAAGDIFDLRGRKVDANTLKKGVYIRNGKKVVIK